MKTEILHTIGLVIVFLLLFLCFNVLHHKIENTSNIYVNNNKELLYRIDSLENELNTFYKNKRDTVIINVVPADVKIYPKIYNN